MKSLRLAALLLLPLLAPTFMAERPSSVSYAQEQRPVRFPSTVAPRNDIHMQNRVPVRMRDGVTLYADVYRPLKEGRYPVIVSRTPYSTERAPSAYDAAVYF